MVTIGFSYAIPSSYLSFSAQTSHAIFIIAAETPIQLNIQTANLPTKVRKNTNLLSTPSYPLPLSFGAGIDRDAGTKPKGIENTERIRDLSESIKDNIDYDILIKVYDVSIIILGYVYSILNPFFQSLITSLSEYATRL